MSLSLKQTVKMSQSLVMTPQLRTAINLLASTRLELSDAVCAEMLENPVLEEAPDEGNAEKSEPSPEPSKEKEVGLLDKNDGIDWEAYKDAHSYLPTGMAGGGEGGHNDLPGIDQTHSRAKTLDETLMWQIETFGFNIIEREIAICLVGEIDEDGYLGPEAATGEIPASAKLNIDAIGMLPPSDKPIEKSTLERLKSIQRDVDAIKKHTSLEFRQEPQKYLPQVLRIEKDLEVPARWVENMRKRLMKLDPVGCFSASLRECLLAQLQALGYSEQSLPYQIVSNFIEKVKTRDYRYIERKLAISKEKLSWALAIIGNLEPKPGRPYKDVLDPPTQHQITPDVYVVRMGDDYAVVTNEDGLPKLRLSRFYLNQLTSNKGESKDFIQEKIRSATWFIKSIHQRQRTICRVVESIVRFQKGWFDGSEPLKPLILRTVADELGVHESTVSRVTNGKYMHTHRGIFELKYFFSSTIATSDGASIASESVKDSIRRLISSENRKKPLSDSELARRLEKGDIHIARRTVAKYRENMGILPSSQRKQLL